MLPWVGDARSHHNAVSTYYYNLSFGNIFFGITNIRRDFFEKIFSIISLHFYKILYTFYMTIKSDRLRESIHIIATESILNFSREYEHNHGIIAVLDTIISPDKSYADIMVFGQGDNKALVKFLAPLATEIHKKISKDLSLRKTPRIRFRIAKNQEAKKDILTTIAELDAQYGLSQ